MASEQTLSPSANEMEETNTGGLSDEIPFLSNQPPSDSMDQIPDRIKEEEPAKGSDLPCKIIADQAPLLCKPEKIQADSSSPSSFTVQRSAHVSPESLKEMEIKYAAYARHDAYGTMGRGQVPLKEKALLLFALLTLVPIRLVLGLIIIVTYYLICRLCTLFSSPNREEGQEDYAHMTGIRRAIIVLCGRFLSRALLFTLGFYWIKETYRIPDPSTQLQDGMPVRGSSENDGDAGDNAFRPGAIVSNHVSYLDILYHMSASFPSFVAKRSVARLPLVGLISKCLGCVYVQRELKSSNFKGVSGVVAERLQAAHRSKLAPMMMLFPEGTTTNGDFLLPFKTGAFVAETPVLPVILKYPYRRFSPAWDTISGMRHVVLLLCQFINYLEVTRLPVYCPSEKEKADSKLYANNVRKLMAIEGNLTMSDIGLPEKRIYHAALHEKEYAYEELNCTTDRQLLSVH